MFCTYRAAEVYEEAPAENEAIENVEGAQDDDDDDEEEDEEVKNLYRLVLQNMSYDLFHSKVNYFSISNIHVMNSMKTCPSVTFYFMKN